MPYLVIKLIIMKKLTKIEIIILVIFIICWIISKNITSVPTVTGLYLSLKSGRKLWAAAGD